MSNKFSFKQLHRLNFQMMVIWKHLLLQLLFMQIVLKLLDGFTYSYQAQITYSQ